MTAAATPGPRHGRPGPSFADATPAEVRSALIPEEAAEFERAWRDAMARATESLDLTEVIATLDSWRRVARLTAARGAAAHRSMYRRAATAMTGAEPAPGEPIAVTKSKLGL